MISCNWDTCKLPPAPRAGVNTDCVSKVLSPRSDFSQSPFSMHCFIIKVVRIQLLNRKPLEGTQISELWKPFSQAVGTYTKKITNNSEIFMHLSKPRVCTRRKFSSVVILCIITLCIRTHEHCEYLSALSTCITKQRLPHANSLSKKERLDSRTLKDEPNCIVCHSTGSASHQVTQFLGLKGFKSGKFTPIENAGSQPRQYNRKNSNAEEPNSGCQGSASRPELAMQSPGLVT